MPEPRPQEGRVAAKRAARKPLITPRSQGGAAPARNVKVRARGADKAGGIKGDVLLASRRVATPARRYVNAARNR